MRVELVRVYCVSVSYRILFGGGGGQQSIVGNTLPLGVCEGMLPLGNVLKFRSSEVASVAPEGW